jgi:hypothetical protein
VRFPAQVVEWIDGMLSAKPDRHPLRKPHADPIDNIPAYNLFQRLNSRTPLFHLEWLQKHKKTGPPEGSPIKGVDG